MCQYPTPIWASVYACAWLCATGLNGLPSPTSTLTCAAKGLEVNKLPEYLRYVRQLPLTPAGKVDKQGLAAEIAFVARAPVRFAETPGN